MTTTCTLYQVKYTLPGKGNFIERGLTREGVERLQNLIMCAGGSGAVKPVNHPKPRNIWRVT